MLALFNKGLVNPPQELNSPASPGSSKRPKLPEQILRDFVSSDPSNAFAMSFSGVASLAYIRPENRHPVHQRFATLFFSIFCSLKD